MNLLSKDQLAPVHLNHENTTKNNIHSIAIPLNMWKAFIGLTGIIKRNFRVFFDSNWGKTWGTDSDIYYCLGFYLFL